MIGKNEMRGEMNPKISIALRQSLERGPQIALFGQHVLGVNSSTNPLLSVAVTNYGKDIHEWWITAPATVQERASEVSKLCAAIVVPDHQQVVFRWPWSTVFYLIHG
jgi:hypothetical protein